MELYEKTGEYVGFAVSFAVKILKGGDEQSCSLEAVRAGTRGRPRPCEESVFIVEAEQFPRGAVMQVLSVASRKTPEAAGRHK